jgi:hypothetical protein
LLLAIRQRLNHPGTFHRRHPSIQEQLVTRVKAEVLEPAEQVELAEPAEQVELAEPAEPVELADLVDLVDLAEWVDWELPDTQGLKD